MTQFRPYYDVRHAELNKMQTLLDFLASDKGSALLQVIQVLGVAGLIGGAGLMIQRGIAKGTLDREYVSVSVDILKQHDAHLHVRQWAVDLLEHHSPVPLPEALSETLGTGFTSLGPTRSLVPTRIRGDAAPFHSNVNPSKPFTVYVDALGDDAMVFETVLKTADGVLLPYSLEGPGVLHLGPSSIDGYDPDNVRLHTHFLCLRRKNPKYGYTLKFEQDGKLVDDLSHVFDWPSEEDELGRRKGLVVGRHFFHLEVHFGPPRSSRLRTSHA